MQNTKSMKKHATHGISQFELTNKLLNNLSQFELSPTEKLVLLVLSTHYNPKKPDMFPKQKTIADKLGISERSVVRAIQGLIKAGLILVESSKYTNHYIFTSKIVSKQPQDEKFFEPEKLSDDLGKNDTRKGDNLTPHEHEPIKEPINQPLRMEDYKILKNYAVKMGATSINGYINKMVRTGGAQKLIQDTKQAKANARAMENTTKKVINDLKFAKENAATVDRSYFESVRNIILQNKEKAL